MCSFVRSAVWGHPQNLVTFLLAALTATSHTSVPCQLAAVLQETRSLDRHRAAESTEHPWIGTGQQKAQSIPGSAQGSRKHKASLDRHRAAESTEQQRLSAAQLPTLPSAPPCTTGTARQQHPAIPPVPRETQKLKVSDHHHPTEQELAKKS